MKIKHILLLVIFPLLRLMAVITTYIGIMEWGFAAEQNPVFKHLFETIGFWPSAVINCLFAGLIIFLCFFFWNSPLKILRWTYRGIACVALLVWGCDAINNCWVILKFLA